MNTINLNDNIRILQLINELDVDHPWKILQGYLESRNGRPFYEEHDNDLFEAIIASGEFRVTMWHGTLKWEFWVPDLDEVRNCQDVDRFTLSTEYPLDSGISLQATYKLEAAWFIDPNQVILENLKKVLGETFMERLVADIVSD